MDLRDGEVTEIKGSAKDPYKIKNIGGAYSCSCMAWRNQSQDISRRTCKHIRKLRGDAAEEERLGGSLTVKAGRTKNKVTAVPPSLLLAFKWVPDPKMVDDKNYVCVPDPKGYWMSEKLNGIRAYWNGTCLISRLGNKIYAPEWFLAPLPKGITLDGELWIGRKMFQETLSIVRRQDYPEDWCKVKYMLFDTPSYTDVFEGRMKALSMLCKKETDKVADHVWIVKQMICKGLSDLMEELQSIENVGGEGLMLRQPKSLYEGCRSETCLKVKSFEDAEAIIVGYTDGTGNRKGMVGAFMVEGCDGKFKGKKFKVGTGQSHAELKDPPPIGTKITFRYVKTDLSNDGLPKPAAYVGLCIDR